jgi:hypothetical protein
MSEPQPGLARIKELYETGKTMNEIAEDPELRSTVLKGIENPRTRSWRIWHIINTMADMGMMSKRESSSTPFPRTRKNQSPSHSKALTAKTTNFYDQHLTDYERFIGAKLRRKQAKQRSTSGRQEIVVISDLHIPDERMDLLAEVAARHKGAACCLAGDINDFEAFGRYDIKDWNVPNLQSALARTDVVMEFLTTHFSNVSVLFGNHDLRLARKAAKQLGPDYYFICQQFLMWAYEKRHGVEVIHHQITKTNGRTMPGIFFYQQIGDCVIGHVEAAGKPVGKGVMMAHDFFFSFRDFLGLEPFTTVLQAHTHKQSYHRNHLTGVHCYEIGALCDVPAYSMNQPKYGPMQHGYFHLVQYDGITDINESRLYTLD